MKHIQADLFAEDSAERNRLSSAQVAVIRQRLEATLARLEATEAFPWSADPLQAVHEENRFERGVKMLGDDGKELWERFDRELDRLYATQN